MRDLFKALAAAGFPRAAVALWHETFDRGTDHDELRERWAWLTEHDPDCGHEIYCGIMAGHVEAYARLTGDAKRQLRETLACIFADDGETFAEALARQAGDLTPFGVPRII